MNAGEKQPIILAAGGTGGHIFPAEALAEALLAMGERVVLVTDKRFANFKTGVFSTIEIRTIHAATVKGRGLPRKLLGGVKFLWEMMIGVMQARKIIRELKPKAVVGFGGYPSVPTVYAARKRATRKKRLSSAAGDFGYVATAGIPTIIHEQNAVLGRANRLLSTVVIPGSGIDRIATSFPATLMLAEKDRAKVCITGNPVRASIRALAQVPYPTIAQDGMMRILVTGGSQGAHIFSEIVPAAIAALPGALRARVRIDQQCREADLEVTRAAYQQLGVNADLATFFSDLPARLAGSHLVIARAGASTVSELATAGRPAILVPLPSAMDNHQYFNANAFEDVGGGWVMTQDGFTAASLSARLESFLTSPATLTKAAENAKMLGSPDAAEKLATLVLEMAKGSNAGRRAPDKKEALFVIKNPTPETFKTEAA